MPERPGPDLDAVREALRQHDEWAHDTPGDEPADHGPQDEADDPADDEPTDPR